MTPHPPIPEPCDECGCLPGDSWGCGCANESCPCSEAEDEECETIVVALPLEFLPSSGLIPIPVGTERPLQDRNDG